ncbi:O-antigen ligase family protein [Nitrincola nitratireducens]|uniref:O-Antigen ligase n=1 Tax=Nitrincola nitratireducens TaxID=1229521 RepID=W9UP97_9GAMM|nr:O-antigen ligase family protein [Nitrincola nitratireducens]EXJ09033.1 O-Antigen ligase [Nitrincola nitratireducens]
MIKTNTIYKISLYYTLLILSGSWYWPINRELDPNFNFKIFGNITDNLFFLTMLSVIIIGISKNGISNLFNNKTSFILIMILVSSLLSNNIESALKSSIRLLIFFTYISILIRDYSPERTIETTTNFFILFVFINAISLILFPSITFMEGLHDGSARGILNHKNTFGFLMLIAFMIIHTNKMNNKLKYTLTTMAFIMVILSNSSTATVLLAVSIMLITYKRISNLIDRRMLIYTTILLSTFLIIFYQKILELIFFITEKGSDFSNRSLLWDFYIKKGFENILIGQGNYIWNESFWMEFNFQTGITGNYSPHNSYLSTFVSYGLIVTIPYFLYILHSLTVFFRNKYKELAHPIYICIPLIFIRGFFESGSMISVNIFIFLLLIAWLMESKSNLIGKKCH